MPPFRSLAALTTGRAASLLPRNHHSQSGPVRIVRTFEPTPPSPEAVQASLRLRLIHLEQQAADQEIWNARNPHKANPKRAALLRKKAETLRFQIRGASEEATKPQGTAKR